MLNRFGENISERLARSQRGGIVEMVSSPTIGWGEAAAWLIVVVALAVLAVRFA